MATSTGTLRDDHFTGRAADAASFGTWPKRVAATSFRWDAALALVVCVMLGEARADERATFPDFAPDTFELVPYQSPGYRFQVIPLDEEPPVGFEQPGFDDTGFETGTAAFGGGGGGEGVDCPLQTTVETEWPVNTQLLVRRTVSVPVGVTNLRVLISIDNDILGVFFNGSRIADFTTHDECPILDEFRFDVPPELVQPGKNLVAFHVLDRGVESFFDARILGELAQDQLVQRLNELIILQQAPLVPISDVSLDSRIVDPGKRSSIAIRYIVAGTGEAGEIRIEQIIADELSVEFLLDGEPMAFGTSSPEEMTVARSLEATQRLAELDSGILSIHAAVAAAIDPIPPELAAAINELLDLGRRLSCRTTCDVRAARAARLASLTAGFSKGGGAGRDIMRDGPLTSVGAAFGASFLAVAAETLTHARIERQRQECLRRCLAGERP